ncbi:hypothetical protein OL548_02650 [Lysinibacillus sp. MHQ-1]|nr:hypothetical protein OL548_02650 [Lysinibacillus sp. MHQ-1]
MTNALKTFPIINMNILTEKIAATSQQIQDIKFQMILLGVLAVVISLIIAMVVGSLMSRPINGMAKAAKKNSRR